MSLQDLVNVQISSSTVSPTRPGFGTPLVAGFHTYYTDRVRFYSSLSQLTGDGFKTTDAIYKAVQAALSQNPAPAKVAVGRRALANTQALQLTLSSSSNLDTYSALFVGWDGHQYQLSMASTGVPATDAASMVALLNANTMGPVVSSGVLQPAVTLTGTPTANEDIIIQITTGGALGTAIFKWSSNGGTSYTTGVTTAATVTLTGTGLTANFPAGTYTLNNVYSSQSTLGFATAASAVVTVTQLSPAQTGTTSHQGRLLDIQNWNPLGSTQPILSLYDNTADPGIATDLAAIQAFAAPGSWYGLALDSNSYNEVTAAAAWAESAGAFLFLYNTSDTGCLQSAITTDIFSHEKALAHARTGGLYSGSQVLSFSGMAWLGKTLPQTPGSLTFMYKTLSGVPADQLSESAQVNLNNKNANYYTPIAGINITVNGWDGAGEFLDIVWGTDALTAQIQIDVFSLLANSLKVPYTDLGVDMLKNVVSADLQLFATPQYNFIATSPAPTVFAPTVASVSSTTRASRIWPTLTFSGKLAGAIHTLVIQGTLTP